MNNLEQKPDGTFYCPECRFVFGEKFVLDLAEEFDGWHDNWHEVVIEDVKNTNTDNLPVGFLDISNGE